jgi:hypothetical protein
MAGPEDRDTAAVDRHVAALMELFDSVQVFVARQERGDGEPVTSALARGAGSFYARMGQVHEWTIRQDEYVRDDARRECREDDDEADDDDDDDEGPRPAA